MTVKSRPRIHFFFTGVSANLRNRRRLKDLICLLFAREKRKLLNLNYIFCSDEFLLEINRKYLNHDFYTDVISFELSSLPREVNGEVYISLDRVRANSILFKVPAFQEMTRVILHGALHLCGYGDKSRAEKVAMRKKEGYYLNLYSKMFHVKNDAI